MFIFIMRGRSTPGIRADVLAFYGESHEIMTLALPGDPMGQPGDVTPDEAFARASGELVVIANGGTTALQVSTVLACTRYTGGRWSIADLQKDRAVYLANGG